MKCLMYFPQLSPHTADAACWETLICVSQVFRTQTVSEKAEGGDYLLSRKHSSNRGLTGQNNTRPAGEVTEEQLICPLNATLLSLQ